YVGIKGSSHGFDLAFFTIVNTQAAPVYELDLTARSTEPLDGVVQAVHMAVHPTPITQHHFLPRTEVLGSDCLSSDEEFKFLKSNNPREVHQGT
ncbi:hypothetical protein J6590_087620, partial [Homalodisca vitripennis]